MKRTKIVLRYIATAAVFLASSVAVEAQQNRIYIAPDDHTDYFWTADDAEYGDAFVRTLDYYLRLADSTDMLDPDLQSRWNCDGWLWLWEYEQRKSAVEFQRLVARIKSGHISVPLNALVSCYGGMPAEAVLRGMYYPGTIERKHNLRFRLSVAMENQTLPLGLASLWAGSGARYSWRGICGCSTRLPDAGERDNEIYRYMGLDGRYLVMKWHSMPFGNASVGGYAEARDPFTAVDVADAFCNSTKYPFNVAGMFGAGWDDFTTMTDDFVRAAQAKRSSSRRVIVSNETDFFEDFLRENSSRLNTERRSYGNEWDLLCASMPETSARVKRAVEKLRAAEAMAVMVLPFRDIAAELRNTRETAWRGYGLYWEHDWTADGKFSRQVRADWQRKIASDIMAYSDALHDSASAILGRSIDAQGSTSRYFVFNPLSWTRSGAADLPYDGASPVHVVETGTGRQVPAQLVTVRGRRMLRIAADNVPRLGYAVYEIRQGAGQGFSDAGTFVNGRLETDVLRVDIDPRGAIRSLVDKHGGSREYIAPGASANDIGEGSGTLTLENAGPVSLTVLATVTGRVPRTTRITIYADAARVDIENVLEQGIDKVETWTFPFAIANPVVHHEEVGAVLRAAHEPRGQYAQHNARTDWLTLNHFAEVSGTGAGVTLSNADCYFMKIGASTVTQIDEQSATLHVLAGGQVDGTHLGIPTQDLEDPILQRFSLMPHSGSNLSASMRFALEHQNPLVTGRVHGGGQLPALRDSMLQLANNDCIVWSLKPAEDGRAAGIIVRVWHLGGETLFSFAPSRGGFRELAITSHIETDVLPLSAGDGLLDHLYGGMMQSYRYVVDEPSGIESAVAGPPGIRATVYPSPARANATVQVELAAAAQTRMTVHDALGRILAETDHGVLPAGRHALPLNTAELRPGVCMVVVRSGTLTAQRRLLITR